PVEMDAQETTWRLPAVYRSIGRNGVCHPCTSTSLRRPFSSNLIVILRQRASSGRREMSHDLLFPGNQIPKACVICNNFQLPGNAGGLYMATHGWTAYPPCKHQ